MCAKAEQTLVVRDVQLWRTSHIIAHAQRRLCGRVHNNDTLESGGERTQLELAAPLDSGAHLVSILAQQRVHVGAIIRIIQKRSKIVGMSQHVVGGDGTERSNIPVGARQRVHTSLISQSSIQTYER